MKKNLLFMMGAMLLMVAGTVMMSCSSDDEEGFVNDMYSTENVGGYSSDTLSAPLAENVLYIQTDNGKIDTCWIYPAYCGTTGSLTNSGGDNIAYEVYPMVFTAVIRNSSLFNVLQFDIWNREMIKIENLEVGTSFSTYLFNPSNAIYLNAWNESTVDQVIPHSIKSGALGGTIKVIGKKIADEGTSFITLSLQDLKFYGYDQGNNKHDYTLNATIKFEISGNGIYPQPENDNSIDIESMLMPSSDEFIFFMMDALNGTELQGRRTFFSEEPAQQECLIINSEEEFRQAYKGDKELPRTWISFDYCSLVIGRTYGEHGGISLGGFDFSDNGDTYQLNVTLNNSVDPNYAYTTAFTDLYFWKICPKMEKKPVVFNRIMKDVNPDPIADAHDRIRSRWILVGYSDADGNYHQVGTGFMGDERFSIEFMEGGRVQGRINDTNDFSCYYKVPYVGKRACYEDVVEHGVINLWDWTVTEVVDDNPISKQFMRISDATQFGLIMSYTLDLFVSPKEFFSFRHEDLK